MTPIQPSKSATTNWVPGLAAGNHTSRSSACVEAPRTDGLFLGSKGRRWPLAGFAPITTAPDEFIADSSSSGYGDLSDTVDCTDDEIAARSDASQSYAIVACAPVARGLAAERDGWHRCRAKLAWHWKGTSYATYASLTLQADSSSRYRDLDWHPQVAVVRSAAMTFGSPLERMNPGHQSNCRQRSLTATAACSCNSQTTGPECTDHRHSAGIRGEPRKPESGGNSRLAAVGR